MAPRQPACLNNIIDLTEDDDGDAQLDTLSEAASKAQAAADRWASQVRSIASPKVAHNTAPNGPGPSANEAVESTMDGFHTGSKEYNPALIWSPLPAKGVRSLNLGAKVGNINMRGSIQPETSLESTQKLPHKGTTSGGGLDRAQHARKIQHADVGASKRDFGLLTPGSHDREPMGGSKTHPVLSSPENAPLFDIFTSVVFPSLKKAKRRAKHTLSEDELMSIGKRVAGEVVEKKLKSFVSQNQLSLTDAQKEELKRFVRSCYHQKVQDALTRSITIQGVSKDQHHLSHHAHTSGSNPVFGTAEKPSTNKFSSTFNQTGQAKPTMRAAHGTSIVGPPEKITDLSDYLRKLESEVLPTDLDEFDVESPGRDHASVTCADEGRDPDIIEPRYQQPASAINADHIEHNSSTNNAAELPAGSSTSEPVSTIENLDLISPSDSSFPPGFDRGRYPAQRRRRGNKYYTPAGRPSESLTSSQSKLSTPTFQHDKSGLRDKHSATKKRHIHSTTDASEVPEDAISPMLIRLVDSDSNAKALLEAVASQTATGSQVAEFMKLTKRLKNVAQPKERSESRGSSGYSIGDYKNFNGDEHLTSSHQVGTPSSSSTPPLLGGSIPPTGKDQVRLLKALANRPETSKIAHHKPHRRHDGRFSKRGLKWPQDSLSSGNGRGHDRVSSESQENPSPSPSSPTHLMQNITDSPIAHAISQKKVRCALKHARSTASAVIHPLRVEKSPTSRLTATTYNPHIERLIADSAIGSFHKYDLRTRTNRYPIQYAEQEALVENDAILRFADAETPQCNPKLTADKPSIVRIESKVIDPIRRPERHISSLLRHRELGSDFRGRNVHIQRELYLRRSEMIEPWRHWKGASGDIVAAAWSPNSTTYAVGAAAHTNPEDVQYNRPCNLLLGDIVKNTLTELPDHRVDRPRPETLAGTYNARQAVYEACDPMVYETVSSVAFCSTANRMYTASHDCTVKIWDTSDPQPCLKTLPHDAHVSSVEASAQVPGLFATGSAVIENAVRVYYSENNYLRPVEFSSERAEKKPAWKIHPECLRWGPTAYTSHLLLAGFHQTDTDEPSQEGQLCLWDTNTSQPIKVIPSSQSILAAAWHPTLNFFATGGAPGGNVLTDKYRTRTVVRTWDLRAPTHYSMEYECTAQDMQDITFHPIDSNIISVGCTDGTSFVWDYRRPEYPLHRLRHGMPLVDWDYTRGSREEVDTGVMMSLWGPGGSLYYTGSSDGMIKAWDTRRHPQDVLVRNVAQFGAGIQSGSFSPDGINLLVGDADGGVHILSSAPCGPQPSHSSSDDVSPELPITLVRAPDGSGLAVDVNDENPGLEGTEAAKALITSGQVILDRDMGLTHGSNYQTLYANYARKEAADPNLVRFNATKTPEEKQFFLRTPEENQKVDNLRRGVIAARRQIIVQEYPKSQAAREEKARNSGRGTKNGLRYLSNLHHPETSRPISTTSAITIEPDGDYPMLDAPAIYQQRPPGKWDYLMDSLKWTGGHGHHVANLTQTPPPRLGASKVDIGEDVIPESEMVEENFWWPRLNESQIQQARENPRTIYPAE